MFKKSFLLLPLFLICCACNTRTGIMPPMAHSQAETHYADLLQMQDLEEGRVLCRILDPWRTDHVVAQYLLVPTAGKHWSEEAQHRYDEAYGTSTLLRVPLQHNTLTSACHAWLLHQLDALQQVAVMCDTAYVCSPDVKQWLRTHPVQDGGTSLSPNTEVMLQAQSDALWISPFENAGINTLSQLPIPTIYCADYMENSPLGRAEWMKFFGRLVGKAQEADSLFQVVATRYDSISHASSTPSNLSNSSNPSNPSNPSNSSNPIPNFSLLTPHSLLPELPYGPTWYVPGGRSTSAQLYQDAGFTYPWADDTHAGSLSLSPEAVLAKAGECDVWYFKYMSYEGEWTRDTFLQQHPYYPQFKAAKEGELWGCNTALSDFFDVTPFRPDLLLESIKNQDERFFKKLK